MIKRISILLVLFVSTLQYAKSNIILTESAQVSLITNTPWQRQVYALFGHTAIRVQDQQKNIDVVFNYGLFDFDSPNFLSRFIKGETYYMIGVNDFRYYYTDYQIRGIGITEQVLHLSVEEKQKIWDALCTNSLPENRVYLYNFFFDNCSTRPRNIIEDNINGKIAYTQTNKEQSFRDLIHECVSAQPWVRFGIDLLIGSDADKMASDREKMFLPIYLKNAYTGADIVSENGITRKLVATETILLLPTDDINKNNTINYPLIVGFLLLFLAVIVSYLSYYKNSQIIAKVFDSLLFFIAGTVGCLIAYLMFFSIHPAINPNWNIVWLNPFMLVAGILSFVKICSKYIYYYHFINFVLLTLLMLAWFLIPQQLESAFIPYILTLILRSGVNVLQYKKRLSN